MAEMSMWAEILFAHPKMMPDLMQHRRADLLDQFFLAVATLLDTFLEKKDHIRNRPGVHHAAHCAGAALIEAEKQMIVLQSHLPQFAASGTVADFHGHFLHEGRELRRQAAHRFFNEVGEMGFAHSLGHGTLSFRSRPPRASKPLGRSPVSIHFIGRPL